MKKIYAIAIAFLIFAACTGDELAENNAPENQLALPVVDATTPEEASHPAAEGERPPVLPEFPEGEEAFGLPEAAEETEASEENECCYCGAIPAHYIFRPPTLPINMRQNPQGDFLAQFANVHSFTYTHLPEHPFTNQLVIWTDEPVRDFSFISLGHTWVMGPMHYYTGEKLFTIDELLPGDAVELNVLFFHYLIASGGITFIDASGERRHMYLFDSMGCPPGFSLRPFEDRTAITPQYRGISPTPAQSEIIARLLGDFELGEVAPLVNYQDQREAFLFRPVYYDRRPTFYGTAREQGAISGAAAELIEQGYVYFFALPLYPETNAGDAILVHSERFDLTFLLIDMDCDDWGRAVYAIVILP